MELSPKHMDSTPNDYIAPVCCIYELQHNNAICTSPNPSIDDVDYEYFVW